MDTTRRERMHLLLQELGARNALDATVKTNFGEQTWELWIYDAKPFFVQYLKHDMGFEIYTPLPSSPDTQTVFGALADYLELPSEKNRHG
jgi:hypothetical protein